MKIAIDIDGVLLDLMVTFCEIFNEKYKTGYTKRDVKNWEFYKDWNITEKECYEIFYKIYKNNAMDVPFIDKRAPEYMTKLKISHDIYIVSARAPQYRSQVIKKLGFHNIKKNEQYIDLILVHHKPYDSKLNQNFNVYVDDNPNLVEPIRRMKERYLLLYDQPWNQNFVCKDNIIRVFNWKEVYETINKL
ncbi:MAG: hypothetical protein ACFFAN_11015 [Promethearchaeota archaeon]